MEALAARRAAIERLAEDVNKKQQELNKSVTALQALQSQLSENMMVMEELDGLEDDAKVYKLVGPILMPQDLMEAQGVVETRIRYIKGQVVDGEASAADLDKSLQEAKLRVVQEQQSFQQAAQMAARNVPPVGQRR